MSKFIRQKQRNPSAAPTVEVLEWDPSRWKEFDLQEGVVLMMPHISDVQIGPFWRGPDFSFKSELKSWKLYIMA